MKNIEDAVIMIMIGLSCFLFGILMYLIGWSSYYSTVGGMLMLALAAIILDLKLEIIDEWRKK